MDEHGGSAHPTGFVHPAARIPSDMGGWQPSRNRPYPPGPSQEWRVLPRSMNWAQQYQSTGPVEFRSDWNAVQYGGNFPVAMATTPPSNTSEWQLYRVLQRANLLQYYDTFIAQGGDDVQQLCEAGEEEFLEIMALVGMASKPLHVRRLQKALQEWVANPAAFQGSGGSSSSPAPGSITAVVRDQTLGFSMHSTPPSSGATASAWTPQAAPRSVSPVAPITDAHSPASGSPNSDMKDVALTLSSLQDDINMVGYSMAPTGQHSSSSPLPTPVLIQHQIDSIAEAAARLSKELPPFEAKELNMKKQINREIQTVMELAIDDPNRLDELRKYAAIYGRFDSKRKNDRPMSLHEISVNEASAQLCCHMPTLLTRREDLFPLARQVVRDSGYQYSKGHSSVVKNEILDPRDLKAADVVVSKKPRLDPVFQRLHDANPKAVKAELDKIHREERMSCIKQDMLRIKHRQEAIKAEISAAHEAQNIALVQKLQQEVENLVAQQLALITEQNDITRKQKRAERYLIPKTERTGCGYGDEELTDSSNFPSGNSSPLNSQDGTDFDFRRATLCAGNFQSLAAQKLMQETLFDEGLRIAQQYGMADFAQTLKELKSKGAADEEGSCSDSELSDSLSGSGKNCQNHKKSESDSHPEEEEEEEEEEVEMVSVKEEVVSVKEGIPSSPENSFQHNHYEAETAQLPNSAGFELSQPELCEPLGIADEIHSVKHKLEFVNQSKHNGSVNEFSEPVQNGD